MRRFRWAILGVMLLSSAILAYALRETIYSLIIVPLAHTVWLAQLIYLAVPQLVKWVLLLVLLSVGIIWKLIPELPASPRARSPSRIVEGRVESLAVGIQRSRGSNYFKWQVANRLGRLSRRISDVSSLPNHAGPRDDSIQRYLDAGSNQSFVDFPTPRSPFARRQPTPLDIDPGEIVAYLESRMELSHDGHTRSR